MEHHIYQKYDALPLIDAVREMHAVGAALEELKAKISALNVMYDALRLNVVPKKLEDAGVRSLTVEGVGRVTVTGDIYVSIPAEYKMLAYQHLRDTGHGGLIQDNINPSTLKAFCKTMIKTGEEIPGDLFKVTPFSRASITKV